MERPFRLDSELAAISVMIPRFDLTDVTGSREVERDLITRSREAADGVETLDYVIPGVAPAPLAVRIYRPAEHSDRLPVLLYLHGGAFVLGGLHTEEERCELYARLAECVVVQVDYRLAPEHPFPAAFEDAMTALKWIVDSADLLGVDSSRIAVGGNSAGGAIAAAVALECRAPEMPDLVLQLLVNPALDHRATSRSAELFVDSPVFNGTDNRIMWEAYLAESVHETDYRASPSLAEQMDGVAPAAIWLAEFDPLRDEGYEYAARLMRAGVSVGLQQYPGTFHGFDSYRMTRVGRRALKDQVLALRGAFA